MSEADVPQIDVRSSALTVVVVHVPSPVECAMIRIHHRHSERYVEWRRATAPEF